MRAWLIAAFALVGCAHAPPTPTRPKADPALVAEFSRLVHDTPTIGKAASFAKEHGLTTADIAAPIVDAYGAFLRNEAYVPAAEIAWRFGMGPAFSRPLFPLQRDKALVAVGRFLAFRSDGRGKAARLEAAWQLKGEIAVGCRYGDDPSDGATAAADARAFDATASEFSVLMPLLDDGCPVDATLRDEIVTEAVMWRQDDFAIRHAAKADWNVERKTRFAWSFFAGQRCGSGFKAVAVMRPDFEDVKRMVETSVCEDAAIPTEGWTLTSEQADALFFAAIRGRKFNVAFLMLKLGSLGDDGQAYAFQEAMRGGFIADLVKSFRFHPDRHDPFMQYAYDLGRFRLVGTYAQSYDWERKAFDALIAQGKWEDAGEVAQYGFSETFRTEGIILAFKAAMAAHDFKSGRYFVARYGPLKDRPGIVTQEMYDAEKDAWYAARLASQPAPDPPKAEPKRKKRRKAKPKECPDGDWCVRAE